MKQDGHCLTCLGGKIKDKSEKIFAIFGDLDELIAVLGLTRAFSRKKILKRSLFSLQNDLIRIGGVLAGTGEGRFFKEKTVTLEKRIDELKDPRVRGFSRPGANKISAFLHLSRAITRRLERKVARLRKRRYQPLEAYLNRLSLFLFWLAVKEES